MKVFFLSLWALSLQPSVHACPWLNSNLQEKPKITDGAFRNDEEVGFAYFGRINGGKVEQIGYITAEAPTDDNTGIRFLYVEAMGVIEKARGAGVATLLYQEKLKRLLAIDATPIQEIRASSMEGTNKEVWLKKLSELLVSKPGYKAPTKKLEPVPFFLNCCAKIAKKYPELIEEALKETPSYKIRKVVGYEKVCPGSVQFDLLPNKQITVNFSSCK